MDMNEYAKQVQRFLEQAGVDDGISVYNSERTIEAELRVTPSISVTIRKSQYLSSGEFGETTVNVSATAEMTQDLTALLVSYLGLAQTLARKFDREVS